MLVLMIGDVCVSGEYCCEPTTRQQGSNVSGSRGFGASGFAGPHKCKASDSFSSVTDFTSLSSSVAVSACRLQLTGTLTAALNILIDIGSKVRQSYDRLPYPAVQKGETHRPKWRLPPMTWIDAMWQPISSPPERVLVAGCGTGNEAFALRHRLDRKSTRLNSSHLGISYAVFC